MKSFLQETAEDLWRKYGTDIENITMLFPSRRASLFFREAISRLTNKPLWQPQNTSTVQLMEELSGLAVGDRIRLNAELFKIYSKYHPEETFDSFYFWGEMLIGDFDAVDKYMIDADTLFANLTDLHDLDSFHTLSDEQIAAIRKFWEALGEELNYTEHKKRFVNVWRTLAPIYHEYRKRLDELGIAYEGMLYRRAVEMIAKDTEHKLSSQRFAVVGFNALSECEKRLFKYLQQNYSVDFYWDYDIYYTDNKFNEAGTFMRENIKTFPQKSLVERNNFAKPKNIKIVSTPSDAVQCKYAGNYLASIDKPDINTAIVLTDESLLAPMLYSIPPQVGEVNITMGYPISNDLAYSFTERLISLQKRKRTAANGETTFYHSDVTGILMHAYIISLDNGTSRNTANDIIEGRMIMVPQSIFADNAILKTIFTPVSGYKAIAEYILGVLSALLSADRSDNQRTEFFSTIAEEITKLVNSVDACGIMLEDKTFITLLRKVLQTKNIPFEGEPLAGVQIMGFLESRALDFRNIVILSMSDDYCPGNRLASPSFIPYSLRHAYGMPTPEQQESMYAYYFYRLLQRAENIEIVYCSRTDERNSGEQSRYISQLLYESPHNIVTTDLNITVAAASDDSITIVKDAKVMAKLNEWLDNPENKLSHTRFFKYIECPLRFYFDSVAGIRPLKELNDEIDGSLFGSILHLTMQRLYTPLKGQHNPQAIIEKLKGSKTVDKEVVKAINEVYLGRVDSTDTSRWGGTLLMFHNVISGYINANILPFDATKTKYTITALEEKRFIDIPFNVADKQHTVTFKGTIDRIDKCDNGDYEIIDYKTSLPKSDKKASHEKIADIDSLFNGRYDKRISSVLQTLLYSKILSHTYPKATVRPLLYHVRKMGNGFTPTIFDDTSKKPITSYADYDETFTKHLTDALSELFNPEIPFRQSEVENCEFCDFATICHRTKTDKS